MMANVQRATLEAELFLTTAELAERWRKSVHTLGVWRSRQEGPPWVEIPNGGILYRASVILEYERSGAKGLTLPRVAAAIENFTDVDAATRARLVEHVKQQLAA